jgi:hypothetical protein
MALADTLRHELRLACRHLWQGRAGAAAAIRTCCGSGGGRDGCVAVFTVGAIAAAQSLQGLLYEVGPIDPPSLAGAAALLLLSSLLACAVPAWRAARVNPLAALREE